MVQNHIDYDFIITKEGKQLFQASWVAGQAGIPLHTAEGIVTIPYRFQDTGDFLVNVTVYRILFNQINPEYGCEKLHTVNCKNGMTIIAIGWTRGNKKALATILPTNY
jgi:hypothetical protein